ncbi:type II secretion system protein N [Polynucleobacter sp. JS-Fieb-80-E5]|uniref:type II secretion system protein N n=1 Tax=Polynucleobacter sp. JS-Fieb-80-E5 TaxID=2081050 RepID=UPI001C0B2532|nr:type II secretion system protein N [Polynucleobacter sp. JS-Fieb-80-E5]MBU3619636.1 type II secretion system protein N [Polynucleobacter sp. JS-Fieb-80-E5]
MKLVLDFTHPKLPKLFWAALVFACLVVIVRQMPISWVSGSLASQTGCRVMLQQPIGTIWQGSAALAFSEPNATEGGCRDPMSVTERFHWSTSCKLLSMTCNTELQFAAFEQAQLISWSLSKTQIAANEIKLPANVLEGLGNPWSTLRPRGELGARWTDINLVGLMANLPVFGAGNTPSSGVIRIIISNLTSPISPVKPLGGYEISANIADTGMNWTLSTTSGPLLLKGQGELSNKVGSKGMQFSGEASASPESQESLIGLLSLLGKKEGDTYRLKF